MRPARAWKTGIACRRGGFTTRSEKPQTLGPGRLSCRLVGVEPVLTEQEPLDDGSRCPVQIDLMQRGGNIDRLGRIPAEPPCRLPKHLVVDVGADSNEKKGSKAEPFRGRYRDHLAEFP